MRVLFLSLVALLILALAGLEAVASRAVLADPLPAAPVSEVCLAP